MLGYALAPCPVVAGLGEAASIVWQPAGGSTWGASRSIYNFSLQQSSLWHFQRWRHLTTASSTAAENDLQAGTWNAKPAEQDLQVGNRLK